MHLPFSAIVRTSLVTLGLTATLLASPVFAAGAHAATANAQAVPAGAPRHIVLLYGDDVGYGDLGCYGATAVATPHCDRLAAEGLRFTDGHCPSATCTPSRYAMLTGEYAWRKQGTGVLPGDAPLIIEPGRTTLASVLKDAGYFTGVVGKWHLGLGREGMDWNGPIKPGPLELGFDYCFLMPATGDRVPCVYVEDHHVVGLDAKDPIDVSFAHKVGDEPTGKDHPEKLRYQLDHGHADTIVGDISRIGWMSGGKAARWKDEEMADNLTRKAVAFIDAHKREPFFLYFATHDIHVPRVPHPRFVGKTEMGPRGDVIAEFDWSVGAVMDALHKAGIADDTLVILSSDNGPVLNDGYKDQAVERLGHHKPAGPFRGGKYSAFEGGTRVPLVMWWPGRIKPGASAALVSQIDFLASFAALTGQKLPAAAAPDSFNVLPALLGDSPKGRESFVEHAGVLSLREGDWKYIEPGKGPARNVSNNETGTLPKPQLYNLADDMGEKTNLAEQHPEKVREMHAALERARKAGRTRAAD